MKHFLPLLALALMGAKADDGVATAEKLRDRALADNQAWEIVESLTTEVGPRLAGTDKEAQARAWGVAKLKALGFQNVRVEAFDGFLPGEIVGLFVAEEFLLVLFIVGLAEDGFGLALVAADPRVFEVVLQPFDHDFQRVARVVEAHASSSSSPWMARFMSAAKALRFVR